MLAPRITARRPGVAVSFIAASLSKWYREYGAVRDPDAPPKRGTEAASWFLVEVASVDD